LKPDPFSRVKIQPFLIDAALVFLALLARAPFFHIATRDWTAFLGTYAAAMAEGGFSSLGLHGPETPPLFKLLLFTVSRAPEPLLAWKLCFMVFEILTAFLGRKLIRETTGSEKKAGLGFVLLLFWPSVIFNASAWGQLDSAHTFFLVLCFWIMMQGERLNPWISNAGLVFLAYGLAFSAKLQSVFFALALARYLFLHKPRWNSYLWFFLPYFLFALPLFAAGRDISNVLGIYAYQVKLHHEKLSWGCANIYKLFPSLPFDPVWKYGIVLTALVFLGLAYALWKFRPPFDRVRELRLAFFSCLLMVYLLPKMHERYYYPAEIFLVILTCVRPAHAPLLLLVGIASVLSYTPYLFGRIILPVPVLAGIMTAAVAAAALVVLRDLRKGKVP
jgi:Gpi18-like mannosyltransferase